MANHSSETPKNLQEKALTFIFWAFGISAGIIFTCFLLNILGLIEVDSKLLLVALGGIMLTMNRIIIVVFKRIFTKR